MNFPMGGGTFSNWGGTSASQKNYIKVLWFALATVTSETLKDDVVNVCQHV